MKQSIFIFGTAFIFSAIVQSCKKNQCHECHYDKAGQEVELGEYCGEALEDLEAQGYTDSTGNYVVHCHGH